jgi:predicted ATP-dependent protease
MDDTPLPARFAIFPRQLRGSFDDADLPATTETVAPLVDVAGQQRARDAIDFGLRMNAPGYHIAVSGPALSGRNTAVQNLVAAAASRQAPPSDWVYVHNFADPRRPRAISLPPGLGDDLQAGLARLVDACRTALPAAFDSESYEERSRVALEPFTHQRDQALEALRQGAEAAGFLVNATPVGLVAVPRAADGTALTQEAFNSLSPEVQRTLAQRGDAVQERIAATLHDLRRVDLAAHEAIEALDRQITLFVVGPAIDDLRRAYGAYGLGGHLDAVEADVSKNIQVFKRFAPGFEEKFPPQILAVLAEERELLLRQYAVNLFVTHGDGGAGSAPLVDERHPTYANLFGKVDFESRGGAMVTDFLHIRPGGLHLANGGYLVLQVQDVVTDGRLWLKLKQALKTGEVRIEDPTEGFMPIPVVNLSPQGIPLSLKVVLVGEPLLLALLDALDPDFPSLFKVRAEFEPDTDCDAAAVSSYVGFVRRMVDTCGLLHFTRGALAAVLHEGNRITSRQDRLTTRYGVIGDLCQEANQLAVAEGASSVDAGHVEQAVDGRRRRSGLVPDRLRRMIAEGTLHIETSGSVVGQVNGLAVYATGSHAFGTPVRITCRVGLGRRGVVAIERETERSGAIHTKGVLVLGGYLMGTFGARRPLAFNASLTFEQSYDEVEGDSASSAELYAILTSLAGVAIRQDVAVTGSVDQFGNIQPVGGVTEKVEGFFDVCSEVGLTGTQGVVIPVANVVNLTLRQDLIEAVEAGRFHLWAINRIEEGLELLTGLPAGTADTFGLYPEGSIFRRLTETLEAMLKASTSSAPEPE